jgi:hypothetical protein
MISASLGTYLLFKASDLLADSCRLLYLNSSHGT